MTECLDLWDSIPNCQFWDIQWTSIISRCIKSCNLIDWEGFLPTLFTRVLNMFEVWLFVFLHDGFELFIEASMSPRSEQSLKKKSLVCLDIEEHRLCQYCIDPD